MTATDGMATTTFRAILRAMQIWTIVAATFVGVVLVCGEHGPWNYYWLFAMGCWFVLDIYWAFAARHTKPVLKVGQQGLPLLTTFLIYALYCLPLSFITVLGQRVAPRFVALEMFGALMCAFGIGFAIWARHVLGKSWHADVTLKQGGALVRHGPYAIVRHPIYFGLLVAVVGMVLVLGELRSFVLLFGVEILLRKMGQEENALRSTFPNEFSEYEQRVKRLIPWVW